MIPPHRVAHYDFAEQNVFRKLLSTSHDPLTSSQPWNHWTTAWHVNRALARFPQLFCISYTSLGAEGQLTNVLSSETRKDKLFRDDNIND